MSQRRGAVSSFFGFDQQGSTRILETAAGAQSDSYLYKSFGDEVTSSGVTTNALRYVGALGYYRDLATRLYVRARYLNPQAARFEARDVVWSRSFGLYGYANNNPVRSNDPSGLITVVPVHDKWWILDPEGAWASSCGFFSAYWDFTLDGPGAPCDGWVVQFNSVSNLYKPDSTCKQPITEHAHPTAYWQAWYVKKGDRLVRDRDPNNPDPLPDDPATDKASHDPHPGTCGFADSDLIPVIGSTIKFFCAATPDVGRLDRQPGWARNDYAAGLLSTTKRPAFFKRSGDKGVPGATRWIYAEWNCCGPLQRRGRSSASPQPTKLQPLAGGPKTGEPDPWNC